METRRETLSLPEGDKIAEIQVYNQSDSARLIKIYESWRKLCDELEALDSRKVNLPEGLSEISFALAKNMWRKKGTIKEANSSFDCYDPNGNKNNNRIQVKASSVEEDLTSFGPKSEWDKIFFIDFYRNGLWDKTFDIYEIKTNDILKHQVNSKETLQDQQKAGKRPRFSIKKWIINQNKHISKETYKITEEGIIKIEE